MVDIIFEVLKSDYCRGICEESQFRHMQRPQRIRRKVQIQSKICTFLIISPPMPPITQAILPVAGLGTRFLPWTKVMPKEMLPVGNQPIIAKIVDECMDAGIKDICFVISKGKEVIPEYFYENPELEEELKKRGKSEQLEHLKKYHDADFHVVYQDEQLGDGHAILQAADWVSSDTVAILFGDDLFTGGQSGIAQLIDAHNALSDNEQGAMFALEHLEDKHISQKGIVDIECDHPSIDRLRSIKGLVEKPKLEDAPSSLGIVGRYLIPKSTLDILPSVGASHSGEIRLIDALTEQLGSINIHGLECEGIRLDTGTLDGYARAVQVLTAE